MGWSWGDWLTCEQSSQNKEFHSVCQVGEQEKGLKPPITSLLIVPWPQDKAGVFVLFPAHFGLALNLPASRITLTNK